MPSSSAFFVASRPAKVTRPPPPIPLACVPLHFETSLPNTVLAKQGLLKLPRNEIHSGETQTVNKVLSAKAIVNLQKLVSSVAVSEHIVKYVARLVRATRPRDASAPAFVQEMIDWGAGPRAGQFLINGGKGGSATKRKARITFDE